MVGVEFRKTLYPTYIFWSTQVDLVIFEGAVSIPGPVRSFTGPHLDLRDL
jgi:hypothetical protein